MLLNASNARHHLAVTVVPTTPTVCFTVAHISAKFPKPKDRETGPTLRAGPCGVAFTISVTPFATVGTDNVPTSPDTVPGAAAPLPTP